MQKILVTKTVSMTELRDPKKVLEFAAGEPVAVMNRNNTMGYFTPAEKVQENSIRYATRTEVTSVMKDIKKQYAKGLDYLKDK